VNPKEFIRRENHISEGGIVSAKRAQLSIAMKFKASKVTKA
jgi:hypothetical protein